MKAVAVLCLALLAGWPLVSPAQNTHTLPLVRPAGFAGQESLVRIVNRSGSGTVRITAIDDTGRRFGPVTLTLGARRAVNITSSNLERGNTAVGLPVGIGDGSGSWRLELATALTIEALAYIRTPDGFLTSMHDVAPVSGGNHWVPIFNPGSNTSKVSHLRIINPGSTTAEVTVAGRDDLGDEASGTVSLTLAAGAARTLSAQALETGVGLDGRLGDGVGKWRLNVRSTTDIQVMSLLSTRTGHLANLSTAPSNAGGEPPGEPPTGDDHGNNRSTATRVGADSTTAGRIEIPGDKDWFRFEIPRLAPGLPTGTTGTLIVAFVSPVYSGLIKVFRGSTFVTQNDGPILVDPNQILPGTWYVEVTGEVGDYSLQIQHTPPDRPDTGDDHGNTHATATRVGANSTTAGRLEARNDVDVQEFPLTCSIVAYGGSDP